METEFKFNVSDPSIFDSIVRNAEINKMGIEAVETINMHAVYFDTESMDFRKRGIAYRIRQEDDRITATIKWDVTVEDGLHKREEFNLVVNDERFAEAPDIGLFISSEAYDVLYEAAGDKKLRRTICMDSSAPMAPEKRRCSICSPEYTNRTKGSSSWTEKTSREKAAWRSTRTASPGPSRTSGCSASSLCWTM